MRRVLRKLLAPRNKPGKKAVPVRRHGTGSMIISFDGRVVRLYLPEP